MGKTTAALGIVLRAVGHGQRVGMIQFIKGEWYYGELTSSKRLEPEFEMIAAGKGFVGIIDDDHSIEDHRSLAQKAVSIAKEKLTSGNYDIVIPDEIHYALNLKFDNIGRYLRHHEIQAYKNNSCHDRKLCSQRGFGDR